MLISEIPFVLLPDDTSILKTTILGRYCVRRRSTHGSSDVVEGVEADVTVCRAGSSNAGEGGAR